VAQPGCHRSRHNDEAVDDCKCARTSGSIAEIMILLIFHLLLEFERQVSVLLGGRGTAKKQWEQGFIIVSRCTDRLHSRKRVAKSRAGFCRPGRRHDMLHNLTKMECTQWWRHTSEALINVYTPPSPASERDNPCLHHSIQGHTTSLDSFSRLMTEPASPIAS
jgi:hypothetical protein